MLVPKQETSRSFSSISSKHTPSSMFIVVSRCDAIKKYLSIFKYIHREWEILYGIFLLIMEYGKHGIQGSSKVTNFFHIRRVHLLVFNNGNRIIIIWNSEILRYYFVGGRRCNCISRCCCVLCLDIISSR